MAAAGAKAQPGAKDTVRVDLNHGGKQELISLPGIGPVIAGRIIDWRTAHGPFKRVDDLLLVRGIGAVRLEKLRPFVTVSP